MTASGRPFPGQHRPPVSERPEYADLPEDLLNTLRAAEYMLDLEPGWADSADSLPIGEECLDRAGAILAEAWRSLAAAGLRLPDPRVSPVEDGSIDLHWRTPHRELLINVPPLPGPAPYYGDDGAADRHKGALTSGDDPVFRWLAEGQ